MNSTLEAWLQAARESPLLEAWSQFGDGNKLLVLLVLSGVLVYATAKSEGAALALLIGAALAVFAYALVIALRML